MFHFHCLLFVGWVMADELLSLLFDVGEVRVLGEESGHLGASVVERIEE